MLQDYRKWERDFIDYPNAVTCQDISANQSDYILRLDFFELPELISIKPSDDSCYIRSVTEPIDEEDIIDLKKVEEWLNMFGLFPYEQIHASGHLNGVELKQMIQEINPKYLIPIHTEKPGLFKDIVGASTEVILPNYAEPIAF